MSSSRLARYKTNVAFHLRRHMSWSNTESRNWVRDKANHDFIVEMRDQGKLATETAQEINKRRNATKN